MPRSPGPGGAHFVRNSCARVAQSRRTRAPSAALGPLDNHPPRWTSRQSALGNDEKLGDSTEVRYSRDEPTNATANGLGPEIFFAVFLVGSVLGVSIALVVYGRRAWRASEVTRLRG